MMELQELIDLDRKLTKVQQAKFAAMDQFIAEHAPYPKGSILVVNEFSYRDKLMKVDSVHLRRHWKKESYTWRYSGLVLNKDGKPGKNRGYSTFPVSCSRGENDGN